MSLCPLSWRNVKRLGRRHGMLFVQASARPSGVVVAVDIEGHVWEIDRDAAWHAGRAATTTAQRIVSGDLSDAWGVELQRRLDELTGA